VSAHGPDLDRYLAIKSARGGSVAADGATVAFVSDLTGIPQAWSGPVGSGWPTELTVGDDRVQAVLASPADADVVVFGRDSGGDERTQLYHVRRDGLGEAALATDPEVIHRPGAFSPDGRRLCYTANDRNGVDFDLFRVSVPPARPEPVGEAVPPARPEPEAPRPERVATLHGWNVVTGVSPDGRYALVAYLRGLLDADVVLVDLASGEATNVSAVDGDRPVASFPGGFAPNGLLWMRSDRAADVIQAGVLLPDGGWRPATPHRWEAEALAVADGAAAAAVNVDGVSHLYLLDPSTVEQRQRVQLPDGVVEDLSVAPGGKLVSFTLSGPTRPPDVWVADVGTGEARQVTRSSTAGIDPATFVEPTLDRIESHDGLAVPVLTYRPPDVDEPPVLVWVHGGPESQTRPAFNALFQHWVACGWAVVAPNVRGSTGYGRRYASLDDGRRRLDAVADLVVVGEWARARPDLGDRVAVAGGSYGGYMTLSALVAEPELWAAGVSVVGIANLVTFLERTGAYRRALREREYGSLEHDRDFLVEASPLTHVERITAPLLVVHGANDPRVPVGEAEQIHEALNARGRTCELLVFDDEGHGIAKLANRRVAYRRIHDFLAAHLEG
jgi:dipeptidyl aminopeptidase/acylaminoacyl peptidase